MASEMERKEKIEELLKRGVAAIYPSREFLEKRLIDGKPLTIYFGIDPTGPTLHLGHAVSLLKLRQFQDLGHNIIILYGGFTAQIGDPTDKLATRQPLSRGQIKKNTINYKKLIGKILDLKKVSIKFLDNEKWSNKLKPVDMLDIASRFTVAQLLERDMFQERIKQGKEIHLHEFLYPVFQAYDAVTMDVDVQIGGNDQTFNMLAGRTLMRKMKNKEKAVLAMKLLVDSADKKMGKTEGNMVALNETAEAMFGKILSWSDNLIVPGLELCTVLSAKEVENLKTDLEMGINPRDAKICLAKEIVKIYHGEKSAEAAAQNFKDTFSSGAIPKDVKEATAQVGTLISEILLGAGLVASKSEFRRLVNENAVSEVGVGTTITDPNIKLSGDLDLRIGKHRFLRIKVLP